MTEAEYDVPPGFPRVLNGWIKEILRFNPDDIVGFSRDYFTALCGEPSVDIGVSDSLRNDAIAERLKAAKARPEEKTADNAAPAPAVKLVIRPPSGGAVRIQEKENKLRETQELKQMAAIDTSFIAYVENQTGWNFPFVLFLQMAVSGAGKSLVGGKNHHAWHVETKNASLSGPIRLPGEVSVAILDKDNKASFITEGTKFLVKKDNVFAVDSKDAQGAISVAVDKSVGSGGVSVGLFKAGKLILTRTGLVGGDTFKVVIKPSLYLDVLDNESKVKPGDLFSLDDTLLPAPANFTLDIKSSTHELAIVCARPPGAQATAEATPDQLAKLKFSVGVKSSVPPPAKT